MKEAKIINGKEIAQKIIGETQSEIATKNLELKLVIIQIGNEESSNIYIRNKIKKAEEVGVEAEHVKLGEECSEEEVLNLIKELNNDHKVTGFFIQTPIPGHLNLIELLKRIDPKKDVDGMTPYNLGALMQGRRDILVSATALACYSALKYTEGFELSGKHAVIVGRSLILGKPLSALLLGKDCTVTVCHSKTRNIKEICKSADILVSCAGKEKLITADFVKEGAFVIDCGAPKAEVDFEEVKNVMGYITPIPGGVGPLTIASLLKNVLKAANLQNQSNG